MGKPLPPEKAALVRPARCQVCGEALEGDLVACRDCETLHHRSCWRYNKGCAVYGCSCRASVDVGGDEAEELPPLVIEQPFVRDPRVLLPLFLLIGVVAPFFPAILAVGPFMPILVLVAFSLSMMLIKEGKWVVEIDGARKRIDRTLQVKRHALPRSATPWIDMKRVVEVHHHRWEDPRRGRLEEVWLALEDGSRELLNKTWWGRNSPRSRFEGQVLADQVAALVDGTVRTFKTRRAPSRDEVLEAAEERRLLSMGEEETET